MKFSTVAEIETSAEILNKANTRAIVKDLVAKTAPREIENVDEMILQFKGRENELIETLQFMFERQSAQKQDEAKRLRQEQEALAQAEVWMSIVEQSKKTSDGNQGSARGASDAADWAIARSLNALADAEKKVP